MAERSVEGEEKFAGRSEAGDETEAAEAKREGTPAGALAGSPRGEPV